MININMAVFIAAYIFLLLLIVYPCCHPGTMQLASTALQHGLFAELLFGTPMLGAVANFVVWLYHRGCEGADDRGTEEQAVLLRTEGHDEEELLLEQIRKHQKRVHARMANSAFAIEFISAVGIVLFFTYDGRAVKAGTRKDLALISLCSEIALVLLLIGGCGIRLIAEETLYKGPSTWGEKKWDCYAHWLVIAIPCVALALTLILFGWMWFRLP